MIYLEELRIYVFYADIYTAGYTHQHLQHYRNRDESALCELERSFSSSSLLARSFRSNLQRDWVCRYVSNSDKDSGSTRVATSGIRDHA
jgi:hypothetical protein